MKIQSVKTNFVVLAVCASLLGSLSKRVFTRTFAHTSKPRQIEAAIL